MPGIQDLSANHADGLRLPSESALLLLSGKTRMPQKQEQAKSGAILVVDDDEGTRLLVRHILTIHGYEVIEAHDGPQALRVAGQHEGPIGLLLTDVSMPRLDGPALAGQLKLERPYLKVLYMSAHSRDLLREKLGREAVLWKPFTPEDLLDRVRESFAAVESELERNWREALAGYTREVQKTLELLDFAGCPGAAELAAVKQQRAAEEQALEKYRRARQAYLDFIRRAALAILLALHFR